MLEFARFHARLCRTLLTQMSVCCPLFGTLGPLRSFGQAALVNTWLLAAAVLITVLPARAQEPDSQRQALVARAKSLELSTPYIPPPAGSPLEYFAAGYAKV